MGLEAATLAAISAGTTAVSTVYSISNNQKAKSEQKKIAATQNASNRQAQVEEQRQKVREERIRRARILQAGEAGGTSGSSGELGALGSMSTQLQSNIGSSLGRIQNAQTATGAQQKIASAQNNTQMANFLSGAVNMGVDMSGSIFKNPDPLGDFINANNLQNK
jgi:hypothetical protein